MIKSFKPTTPSRRQMTVSGFDGIDKKAKPEPSLTEVLKKNAGRNSYGHITVLWDLSLTFREGALTAIVGPNGAGKTTLLRALTGLIPYEGEIRLGIDRVFGRRGALAGLVEAVAGEGILLRHVEGVDVFGNPREARRGQLLRAEQQVAVRALKARFKAHLQPGLPGPVAGILRGEVGEPVAERGGVGTPADRFAVGVENRQFDVGQPVLHQHLGDAQAQALDPEGRRQLADIAAGIRVAELHGEAADALEIGPPMGVAQGVVEDPDALFQGARRLEQGRDLELVGDAVVAGEPEGGEQGVARLRLGDEEAHRMGAVDVLEDLRDRHHQPGGGGALGGQRPEIHRHRRHIVEKRMDGGEVRAALGRVGGLALQVDHPPDGVVDLRGVQPEMRQGVRQAVGLDARP